MLPANPSYLERAIDAFERADIYEEPYESRYLAESWYWLLVRIMYNPRAK